mmetsp:Transcript_128534/g.363776  ORF Transcript_128534/g.363776 Transcript_128534/m.363776 type:complete len:260 (-) Transcript_128534:925-1704(-)
MHRVQHARADHHHGVRDRDAAVLVHGHRCPLQARLLHAAGQPRGPAQADRAEVLAKVVFLRLAARPGRGLLFGDGEAGRREQRGHRVEPRAAAAAQPPPPHGPAPAAEEVQAAHLLGPRLRDLRVVVGRAVRLAERVHPPGDQPLHRLHLVRHREVRKSSWQGELGFRIRVRAELLRAPILCGTSLVNVLLHPRIHERATPKLARTDIRSIGPPLRDGCIFKFCEQHHFGDDQDPKLAFTRDSPVSYAAAFPQRKPCLE